MRPFQKTPVISIAITYLTYYIRFLQDTKNYRAQRLLLSTKPKADADDAKWGLDNNRIGTITEVSLRYIMWDHFCIGMLFYASDLLAKIVTRL